MLQKKKKEIRRLNNTTWNIMQSLPENIIRMKLLWKIHLVSRLGPAGLTNALLTQSNKLSTALYTPKRNPNELSTCHDPERYRRNNHCAVHHICIRWIELTSVNSKRPYQCNIYSMSDDTIPQPSSSDQNVVLKFTSYTSGDKVVIYSINLGKYDPTTTCSSYTNASNPTNFVKQLPPLVYKLTN